MDNHNQELQHGAVVAPISQSSLAAASASIVPMNSSLDIMNKSAIIPLSNTQQVISLRLSNTNFLYWRLQMKPFLLGQGVYSFVDGTSPCPPSHLISTATSLPSVNPSFLLWKQQDNLIMSALLSSLSTEVLHLVVDCKTSQEIWTTLETSLASPSNSRIMQLHGAFQDLRQHDDSASTYLQKAKALFDELAAAGRPISMAEFNLYVFRGYVRNLDSSKNRFSSGSGQQFGQQGNRSGGYNRTTKCQLCYDYGHTAQQCSQLATHNLQANANLAFNTAPITAPVTWFPDTGANHHVTPDLASMTSSEPYCGNDNLHVGDGKSSRLTLKTTGHQTQAPLDLIFSDVWGSDLPFSLAGSSAVSPVVPTSSEQNVAVTPVGSPISSPIVSSSQLGPVLSSSSPGSSSISSPGLNLCVDLSQFSLQQATASESATPPPTARTHSMILRPRVSKTANFSVSPASRVVSLPQQEPLSFKDANRYIIWHNAMTEEIKALHGNHTWSLVPLHPSMNVVGSRWVYKIKRHADGRVDRYKARLVARGFTQQEGIDYLETFSPVVKPTTVRLVITIAVTHGWKIHQLDVHNAFLNGILQEEATASYGLHITRDSSLSLHGFTDADWAGSIDDRKSTGGYLVYLGSTPISWKSGKQRTVARSSTEAEYKALADGTAEILWIRSLLSELRLPFSPSTTLWCDNLGATFLSANPVFHARTKHVEVDYHFVRDRVAKKEIQVQFISSQDQLADVLTKPLPLVSFGFFRSKLRVESPPSA
ncbi:uncharacterized protein [Populus alba]|uniref:uncharacterized protein n=1 Tax=Populus alba TaxID=43335 RepID=UPI003CC7824C